jgi:hypothetical protein
MTRGLFSEDFADTLGIDLTSGSGHSRRFSDVRLKSAYPLEAAQERTFDHFRIRANFVLARTPYHTPKEPNRMKSL